MATTTEEAIQEALFARLATLVLSPVHPVSWPNISFNAPSDRRYLEVKFVPNVTDRLLVGSNSPHQRMGFPQVNVRDALNQGPRVVGIAGAVAAHFQPDLKLHHAIGISVRIMSKPDVSGMMVETSPPGVVVPVLIPWECFA